MRITFVYPQTLWLLALVPLTLALGLLGRRNHRQPRLWAGLGLRTVLLLAIILALAGMQLRLKVDTLTTVFVLDMSDSLSPSEQARGDDAIRQALEDMPTGDRAAIIAFGKDALVERLASEEHRLGDLASVPISTRTDIAGALQLAMAVFPDEGAKRLVLLSDGRQNLNQALDQAELAAAQDIELLYMPLGADLPPAEVLVESVQAPADVRQGQGFDLNVVVHSSAPSSGSLRVFSDGDLVHTQQVTLQSGANRFQIPVESQSPGFRRFRVQIVPDQDSRLQNNLGSAFTVVHGPPRILLVEGQSGAAENLRRALEAAQMEVAVTPPGGLPTSLPELAAYEAVILDNVPAGEIPPAAMQALPVYVRELGKGLWMVGGEDAYGAGGYLRSPIEEALPVYMEVKNKDVQSNLALVLAVDKSGSMGRCHCDDPDLNQSYDRVEVGQPKVDIAKEAIMRSASALGDQDSLGVVAFDQQARWALQVGPVVDPHTLEGAIGAFQAEGQTNLRAGVEAAYQALEKTDARRKHIILMTDGWVHTGDLSDLARQMQDEGITLSVIAAGGGSAEYLESLSQQGGGRYYSAVDILSVPDIFLKETVKSVGQYIIEGAFYPIPAVPSPILSGIDPSSLPPLLGYNGTSPKNTARIDLITPRGDPLLASWQYGLGRAAAWTSDLKAQWARDWLGWGDYARFVAQTVGWILPAPQMAGLEARARLEDQGASIELSAQDQDGRPLNFLQAQATLIDPDLDSRQVPLEQVGPGQYRAQVEASQPGTYLVRVGANDGDQSLGMTTLGLVVPYSPEYKTSGTDLGLLAQIAQVTGGHRLEEPLQAFVHNLPSAERARDVWRGLLLAAALMFPLDVGVRRLALNRRDFQKALHWLRGRWPSRPAAGAPRPKELQRLFQTPHHRPRKQRAAG
jgi:Ca-activated chloride channel family protein